MSCSFIKLVIMCQGKQKEPTRDTDTDSGEDVEGEVFEEDEGINDDVIIRAKWSLDGCSTIDEIIDRLKEQIESYKQLKEEGWELREKIDDDYGFMYKKS